MNDQPANKPADTSADRTVGRVLRLARVERGNAPRSGSADRQLAASLGCDPYNRLGRDCAELLFKRLR